MSVRLKVFWKGCRLKKSNNYLDQSIYLYTQAKVIIYVIKKGLCVSYE